jgi:ABC-type transporter Mla subunit MlaD
MKNFKPRFIDYVSGIFIVSVFFILGITLYYTYNKKQEIKYITFYTYFDSTYRISKDSSIYYLDMPIGKVSDVNIVSHDKVKFILKIEEKYGHFVTKDSKITIFSSFGLNTFINGKGLELINAKSKELLKPNSEIKAQLPENLESLIKKFEIDKLSKSLKNVIFNLESISIELNKTLPATMKNINEFSYKLSNEPILKTAVGKDSFNKLQKSLDALNEILYNSNNLIISIEKRVNGKDIDDSLALLKKNLNKIDKILIDVKVFTNKIKDIDIKEKNEQINEIIKRTNDITRKIHNLKIFQDHLDTKELNIK